jgi:hypothetical protein
MLENAREDSHYYHIYEQSFQELLHDVEISIQRRNEKWFIFLMIALNVGVVLMLVWWWKR